MALLEELASILQTAGLGTIGMNLFMGWLPDMPPAAMVLYETGGFPTWYIATVAGPAMDRPGVQLLVRDTTYPAGRARMEQAYVALSSIQNQAITGRWYAAVRPIQAPFALGPDQTNRPQFVVNFVAMRAAA